MNTQTQRIIEVIPEERHEEVRELQIPAFLNRRAIEEQRRAEAIARHNRRARQIRRKIMQIAGSGCVLGGFCAAGILYSGAAGHLNAIVVAVLTLSGAAILNSSHKYEEREERR